MDLYTSIAECRLGRRRLFSVAVAALVSGALRQGVASHDSTPTPTPAPSSAGTKESTPSGSPSASPAATGPVFESTMQSLKYIPAEIEIEAGTTVVWTNLDVVAHTVTHKVKIEDQLFDSPWMGPGDTFSFTFEERGKYPIYCLPHPFMTQMVVVSE